MCFIKHTTPTSGLFSQTRRYKEIKFLQVELPHHQMVFGGKKICRIPNPYYF
jgi:hypothetical protein